MRRGRPRADEQLAVQDLGDLVIEELYAAGQTIVVITHDQGIAKLASRIVQIRDGQIVEDTKAAA